MQPAGSTPPGHAAFPPRGLLSLGVCKGLGCSFVVGFLNTFLSLLGVPRRASRQQLCELGASQHSSTKEKIRAEKLWQGYAVLRGSTLCSGPATPSAWGFAQHVSTLLAAGAAAPGTWEQAEVLLASGRCNWPLSNLKPQVLAQVPGKTFPLWAL